MATFKKEDKPDLTIPEDEPVVSRLAEMNVKTINWTDKRTNKPRSADLVEWWWEVEDDRFPGRKVKGECDAELSNHPANKFNNWTEALLGREIGLGEVIDDEDLIGLRAIITVRHREGTTKNGDPRVFEEVAEVLPYQRRDDDVPF